MLRPGKVGDQDHLNKKEDTSTAEGAIQPASVEAEGTKKLKYAKS